LELRAATGESGGPQPLLRFAPLSPGPHEKGPAGLGFDTSGERAGETERFLVAAEEAERKGNLQVALTAVGNRENAKHEGD